MSEAYRSGRQAPGGTPESTTSYLATRMPATYAAAYSVLAEVHARIGEVTTILDVGAGAGAASLAAHALFPQASLTLIERDPAMLAVARVWLPGARFIASDVTQMLALPPHDLVIGCYSVGEFSTYLADRLWQAARVALVVIEPGTPRGFATIRHIRDQL